MQIYVQLLFQAQKGTKSTSLSLPYELPQHCYDPACTNAQLAWFVRRGNIDNLGILLAIFLNKNIFRDPSLELSH